MARGAWAFLLAYHLFYSVLGEPHDVCISPGGRFPPFSSEGRPPKSANRGPNALTLCRLFRKKTCCSVAQTHPALLSIRKLASMGEAGEECLQLWELLECSICDPRVGVQPGPPTICASFCEKVFHACSEAYFAMDVKNQILTPCGVNDFICGRASKWVSNGTELCKTAGFVVKTSEHGMEGMSCYGGKAGLDSVAGSWSSSSLSETAPDRAKTRSLIGRVRDVPLSWAVVAVLLTAGLHFMYGRKNDRQRQKLAAIQRAARKLESRRVEDAQIRKGNRRGGR